MTSAGRLPLLAAGRLPLLATTRLDPSSVRDTWANDGAVDVYAACGVVNASRVHDS